METAETVKLRRSALILITVALAALGGLVACEPAPPRASAVAAGEAAVRAARGEIGQPYRYGAASRAQGGYDCSGLTSYAWRKAGVSTLPRSSRYQWAWVDKVSRSQLRAGDLVFYSASGPRGTVSHVAMYEGNGMIVHARRTGMPVREDSLASYWTGNLVGYGRIPASALPR